MPKIDKLCRAALSVTITAAVCVGVWFLLDAAERVAGRPVALAVSVGLMILASLALARALSRRGR